MPWYLWVAAWLTCGLIVSYGYWRERGDDADGFLIFFVFGPIGLVIWLAIIILDDGSPSFDGLLIRWFKSRSKAEDTEGGE